MGSRRNRPEVHQQPYNIHHAIPKCRQREGYETESEFNLGRIRTKFHQRIHALFQEATPQEQLKLLLDVNIRVLSEKVRHLLGQIVCLSKEEFYRPEVLYQP